MPIDQTTAYQAFQSFSLKQYKASLQKMNDLIEKQPNVSTHYSNRALNYIGLGQEQSFIADLHKAISLNYLNYLAYFNLFSYYFHTKEFGESFKNICSCISIAYLLRGKKHQAQADLDHSIQYCFNNKEARLIKAIMKFADKKYLEALNLLNYAIYLDPSNQQIQKVVDQVYKAMHMKELKNQKKHSNKSKFTRLETTKEIPKDETIKEEIQRLLKQFNLIMKDVSNEEVFKTQGLKNIPMPLHRRFKEKQQMKNNIIVIKSEKQIQSVEKHQDSFFNTAENSTLLENSDQNSSLEEILKNIDEFSKFADNSISSVRENLKTTRFVHHLDLSKILNNSSEKNISSNESFNLYQELSLQEQSISKEKKFEIKVPRELISNLKENEKVIVTFKKIKNAEEEDSFENETLEIVNDKNGFKIQKIYERQRQRHERGDKLKPNAQ